MTRKKKWLLGIALSAGVVVILLFASASYFVRHFQPYIREQAIEYLRHRFDSQVELASLRVRIPSVSHISLLLHRGRNAIATVEGERLLMRLHGRHDIPPMFVLDKFSFSVDLGTLFSSQKKVNALTLEGMKINIPPKGQRPDFGQGGDNSENSGVLIDDVMIRNAELAILPKDPSKVPLQFHIFQLHLTSAGTETAMTYEARLTNPKPPGDIQSHGSFGPWSADEPADTPLRGNYTFKNADLGVFPQIAGILNSTGEFDGTLSSINAHGEASVPDFRMTRSGNHVPLTTKFQVLVDGTNGNTILQPVDAILGSSHFTTSGGVIKHEGNQRRTIELSVSVPKGNLADFLRLAMKGPPFLDGTLFLRTTIDVPPLSGKVKEKLVLDGTFEVSKMRFAKSTVQDQVDKLSRRGRGRPKDEQIDNVNSVMGGAFKLDDQVISFKRLSFNVLGASVDLMGRYDMAHDTLDFHGTLGTEAKLSQMVTGWKSWLLKPVDPFFSKQGMGALLHIKIEGSSDSPKFGLDFGHNDEDEGHTALSQRAIPASFTPSPLQ